MFNFLKKRSALSVSASVQELSLLFNDELSSGKLSSVFSAVSVISSTISSLSLQMFKEKDGVKALAKAHPLYKLLKHKPNPYMSANAMIEALINNMLLYGVGYLYPRKNALGQVIELQLLQPSDVALTNGVDAKGDKTLYYLIKGKSVAYADVLSFVYYSEDGITGSSPLKQCPHTIALGRALDEHSISFFKNGAFPSGVLSFEGELSDEGFNRIAKGWQASFSKDKSYKTAILESGGKYTPISVDAQKSQLSELKAAQVLEIARLYRIPPHKLGELSRATFSNIEQSETNYMTGTINPLLRKIEAVLNAFLLNDKERDEYYFKFNANSILRADATTRMNNYVKAIQNGIFSINEVRAMEERNPINGGDEHYINLGQGSVGDFQGIQNEIEQSGESKQ